MHFFMKWLGAVLVGLCLTGCMGLQIDYVRTETRVETRGLTPRMTALIMQGATPAVKAGCPDGVQVDERRFRAERILGDPMIYGSQYRDSADAALRIQCVEIHPQQRR